MNAAERTRMIGSPAVDRWPRLGGRAFGAADGASIDLSAPGAMYQLKSLMSIWVPEAIAEGAGGDEWLAEPTWGKSDEELFDKVISRLGSQPAFQKAGMAPAKLWAHAEGEQVVFGKGSVAFPSALGIAAMADTQTHIPIAELESALPQLTKLGVCNPEASPCVLPPVIRKRSLSLGLIVGLGAGALGVGYYLLRRRRRRR